MEFKIGDTVSHKNGGPEMTIEYIVGQNLPESAQVFYARGMEKGAVICTWNAENGIQGSVFKESELKKAGT